MPEIALVLVGGLGRRLRTVVNDRPKVLALAAGQPFLHYVLAYLKSQGIQTAILCTGYLSEQVRAFAGDGKRWGLDIRYSVEEKPLGTAGALRQASQGLAGTFFALNGDTLFAARLPDLWKAHQAARPAATVALLPVENAQGRGCVSLAGDGKILSFNEKPDQPQPGLINAGVYVLEPEALEEVPPGSEVSIERQVFPRLAAEGRLGGAVMEGGYFADIGTPESLAAFEQDIRLGKIRLDGG